MSDLTRKQKLLFTQVIDGFIDGLDASSSDGRFSDDDLKFKARLWVRSRPDFIEAATDEIADKAVDDRLAGRRRGLQGELDLTGGSYDTAREKIIQLPNNMNIKFGRAKLTENRILLAESRENTVDVIRAHRRLRTGLKPFIEAQEHEPAKTNDDVMRDKGWEPPAA